MSIKNIVTGQLASITEYTVSGEVTDILTTGNVTAATISAGTGNLQITGNTISSTASTITIDPLGDGGPLGSMIVTGNLQVTGTLTYNNIVNATTNDLQWIAANNAASQTLATGAGLSVGPAGAYAQFTYNSVANSWQSSLPLGVDGNVTADYFIGDGSQLTGLPPTYANANVAAYLASNANVAITTTGNVTANYFIGDGSQLTGITPLRAGFAKYTRTTDQTGVTTNSVVICNVLENISGDDIAVNTTTGSITLQPGKTYRLRGTVGYCNSTNGTTAAMGYQWWNVTTSSWVGQGSGVNSTATPSADAWQMATAEFVVTPTVITVMQLRVVGAANSNTIQVQNGVSNNFNWRIGAPFIDIEVLGGQAPYTNPTPPAFSVTSGASVVITVAYGLAQIPFGTVEIDTNGWYSTSTNRYTPQRTGWYQINVCARAYTGNPNSEGIVSIRKNGTGIATSGSIGLVNGTASKLIYCNGTTDYIDVVISNQATGTAIQNSATSFSGFWVRS